MDKVANPKSILSWFRHKRQTSLSGGTCPLIVIPEHFFIGGSHSDSNEIIEGMAADDEEGGHQTIASLLKESLLQDRLSLLSEKNLVEAVDEFVEKNERESISE